MDLSVRLGDSILNLRVVALIRNEHGYLFEKNSSGYYYAVGGRIKLNESSFDALKREVFEELNHNVQNAKLVSIIENFFTRSVHKVHEINFVYMIDEIFTGELPNNFISILPSDFGNYDIRPTSILNVIKNRNTPFEHIAQKK